VIIYFNILLQQWQACDLATAFLGFFSLQFSVLSTLVALSLTSTLRKFTQQGESGQFFFVFWHFFFFVIFLFCFLPVDALFLYSAPACSRQPPLSSTLSSPLVTKSLLTHLVPLLPCRYF
jgi:hypothetical protein